MSVFLIQTNGRDIGSAKAEYTAVAKGSRMVDEPLKHHQYINATPHWKETGYGRQDAWHRASEGDTALLYCDSTVDEHGACLSHIFPIENKVIDSEKALLELGTPIEIVPKISYQEIHDLVNRGEFSKDMRYCGQQGFNFTQVADSDLDRVRELTSD